MASYYTSQAYDASASLIWSILTDFPSWPRWFPNISSLEVDGNGRAAHGVDLVALDANRTTWTRWRIVDWREPELLVCEHIDTNAPLSSQVQAAYLQFVLEDEPEGCTLEVEIGAEGYGLVGDFFIGATLGSEVRRLLPRLMDAFTAHVIETVRTSGR
jgi:carbon monoxide dehydrogenase subunit G